METKKQPILSIGMIVKDEIRCLERCLKSLEPLRQAVPSELIIADTGSTDGTRALAAQYADILFDFAWCNDFAAARNAVMERATGVWYLSIDADEFFDEDIRELVDYFTTPQRSKADVCTLTIRNYNTPDMLGQYTDFAAVRILRMSTGLRYEGPIHEHWPLKEGMPWYPFSQTILHHDGYAFGTGEDSIKKAVRNLEILEPQLRKTPDVSGGQLLECLDSAISIPEKAKYYAKECVSWLSSHERNTYWEAVGPAIMRKVVDAANRYHMQELEEWITQAMQLFPESPFIQIDVAYQNILLCYAQGRYEELLRIVPSYYDGVDAYHAGKYGVENFGISGIYRISVQSQQEIKIIEAQARAALGQKAEALEVLRTTPMPDNTPPKIAMGWLDAAALVAELPGTPEVVAQKMEDMLRVRHGAPREQVRREACLKRMAASFLPGQEKEEWRLYQEIPSELGICAKCMSLAEAKQIESKLEQILHWKEVPIPVINHAIVCKAKLPDAFYRQSQAYLLAVAEKIWNYDPDFAEHLSQWPRTQEDSLTVQYFRLEVAFFALCNGMFYQEERRELLYRHLCEVTECFFEKLYQPNLGKEDVVILPALQRCCWYLVCEQKAIQTEQWKEAVYALRMALEAYPNFKEVAQWRLENIQRQKIIPTVPPELLTLAEQVRNILAQYPADDPAIITIKQSEAYQKVAYLIEGMDAPVFGGLPQ